MKKLLAAGSFCLALASGQHIQLKVANAASLQASAGIAPRTLVAISGPGLANFSMAAPDPSRPPSALGGVSVSVNDVPCGVISVSPTQVIAYLDGAIQVGQVELALTAPAAFAVSRILVEPRSSPALFTLNGRGSGDGAIVNQATLVPGPVSVAGPGGPSRLMLFATGLDAGAAPVVRVNGLPVPVLSYQEHSSFQGVQRIDVRLAPELAGAGRVEVVVEQSGRPSNATDIVILPDRGVFPSDRPNQTRSRELAAIAWVPGTGLALVADENDDVVRVVDLSLKRVTRVIALPDGARPMALGVWGTGTLALVAQYGRDSLALLDLITYSVAAEYPVGRGPSAIAVSQDQAVVICSGSDEAHFFDFRPRQITGNAATGRLPRGVAADRQRVYVTNQSDGTITALDWTTRSAVNTIKLGVDFRPGAVEVLPEDGFLVVAEPSAGPQGRLIFVNPANGAKFPLDGNPDRSGGASQILLLGETLYLANPSGGSVTALGATFTTTSVSLVNPRNLRVEAGARALAFNARDNLLLALNQGAGSVSLIDPANFAVLGRIDAVRVNPDDDDDHSDRRAAPNLPTLTAVYPSAVQADSTFLLQLTGTNLAGATAVLFLDPQTIPLLERGRGHWNRGNSGQSVPGIAVSDIRVTSDGTALAANVFVARGHATAPRAIRVLTPNGESALTGAPVLFVSQ
jgi:uncharacterized protein (TIGR03437 family)